MAEITSPILSVGVVADTHVPDRVRNLHPELLPGLKERSVEMILHAGDICSSRVLAELSTVAPVIAVAGNRDWLMKPRLPKRKVLRIAGVDVLLLHGHGDLKTYLVDKLHYFFDGYQLDRYQDRLVSQVVGERVVVFGHTHRAVSVQTNGFLLFNPGTAGGYLKMAPPSYGVLRFLQSGKVESEIVKMENARVAGRKWVAV